MAMLLAMFAQVEGGVPLWVEQAQELVKLKRAFHSAASRLDGDRDGYPEALARAEDTLCASAPSTGELIRQVETGPFSSEAILAIVMQCRDGESGRTARTILMVMPKAGKGIQSDIWFFLNRLPMGAIKDLWPLIEVRLREVKDWRTALDASLVLRNGPPATQGEILGAYFVRAPSVSRRPFAMLAAASGPLGIGAFRAKVLESGDKSATVDLGIIEDG